MSRKRSNTSTASICVWLQGTQSPTLASSSERDIISQEGGGRQVQDWWDPQLRHFFKYKLCALSIWPSQDVHLAPREAPRGHELAVFPGICVPVRSNGVSRGHPRKPISRFPLPGGNQVTWPFLNQSLARGLGPPRWPQPNPACPWAGDGALSSAVCWWGELS